MKQLLSYRFSITVLSFALFVGVVRGQAVKASNKNLKPFTIKGEMNGLDGRVVKLVRYADHLADSAVITGGRFVISGTVGDPVKCYVMIVPLPRKPDTGNVYQPADEQEFYLCAGETSLKGASLEGASIGNPVQRQYVELLSATKAVDDEIGSFRTRIYFSKNADSSKTMKDSVRELMLARTRIEIAFVRKHPASYVSYDVVRNHFIVMDDVRTGTDLYTSLDAKFRDSEEGLKMKEQLIVADRVEIGRTAMLFTQNDTLDRPVSLASFKGKYVLVDFWASWCGPCRMEYPFLHKAYDKYKDKNFTIVGVSLDSKKDIWIKAIKENNFTWPLVCDLKGFKNEVAVAYGVRAIPQSFLLDPNGVIIAKNLRGDDLIEKLDEVIKP